MVQDRATGVPHLHCRQQLGKIFFEHNPTQQQQPWVGTVLAGTVLHQKSVVGANGGS
jgi:hypothetical protein